MSAVKGWLSVIRLILEADFYRRDLYALLTNAVMVNREDMLRFTGGEEELGLYEEEDLGRLQAALVKYPLDPAYNTDPLLHRMVKAESRTLYYFKGLNTLDNWTVRLAYSRLGAKATAPGLFRGECRSVLVKLTSRRDSQVRPVGDIGRPVALFYDIVEENIDGTGPVTAVHVLVLAKILAYGGGATKPRTIFDRNVVGLNDLDEQYVFEDDAKHLCFIYDSRKLTFAPWRRVSFVKKRAIYVSSENAVMKQKFESDLNRILPSESGEYVSESRAEFMADFIRRYYRKSANIFLTVACLEPKYSIIPDPPVKIWPNTSASPRRQIAATEVSQHPAITNVTDFADLSIAIDKWFPVFDSSLSELEQYTAMRKLGFHTNTDTVGTGLWFDSIFGTGAHMQTHATYAIADKIRRVLSGLCEAIMWKKMAANTPGQWTPEANPAHNYVQRVINPPSGKRDWDAMFHLYYKMVNAKTSGGSVAKVSLFVWFLMGGDPFFDGQSQMQINYDDALGVAVPEYAPAYDSTLPSAPPEENISVTKREEMIVVYFDTALALLEDTVNHSTHHYGGLLSEAISPAASADELLLKFVQFRERYEIRHTDVLSMADTQQYFVNESSVAVRRRELIMFAALDRLLRKAATGFDPRSLLPAEQVEVENLPPLLGTYVETIRSGMWSNVSQTAITHLARESMGLSSRLNRLGRPDIIDLYGLFFARTPAAHPSGLPLYLYVPSGQDTHTEEAAGSTLMTYLKGGEQSSAVVQGKFAIQTLGSIVGVSMTRLTDALGSAVHTTIPSLLSSWGGYNIYREGEHMLAMGRTIPPIDSSTDKARLMIFKLAAARYLGLHEYTRVDNGPLWRGGWDSPVKRPDLYLPNPISTFVHSVNMRSTQGRQYLTWRSGDSNDLENFILAFYTARPSEEGGSELFPDARNNTLATGKLHTLYDREQPSGTPVQTVSVYVGSRTPLPLFVVRPTGGRLILHTNLAEGKLRTEQLLAAFWVVAMTARLETLLTYDILAIVAVVTGVGDMFSPALRSLFAPPFDQNFYPGKRPQDVARYFDLGRDPRLLACATTANAESWARAAAIVVNAAGKVGSKVFTEHHEASGHYTVAALIRRCLSDQK